MRGELEFLASCKSSQVCLRKCTLKFDSLSAFWRLLEGLISLHDGAILGKEPQRFQDVQFRINLQSHIQRFWNPVVDFHKKSHQREDISQFFSPQCLTHFANFVFLHSLGESVKYINKYINRCVKNKTRQDKTKTNKTTTAATTKTPRDQSSIISVTLYTLPFSTWWTYG